MTARLNAALASAARGNTDLVAQQPGAFINEVNAQHGKKVSGPQSDALIIAAEATIKATQH